MAQYEFDVLIGADGKRNTLHGFKRKEFRGKLAMAITANFINRHTEQEASVSCVIFIYVYNKNVTDRGLCVVDIIQRKRFFILKCNVLKIIK